MGSTRARDQTGVSYFGRWTLHHSRDFFFFLNKNFEKLIIRKSTNQKNDKESLLEAHRRGSPSGYKQRKSSSMTVILRKCKCYTSLSHAGKEDIILTPVETVRKTLQENYCCRGGSQRGRAPVHL